MRRAFVTRLARRAPHAMPPLPSRPLGGYGEQTLWLRQLEQHVTARVISPNTQRFGALLLSLVLEQREEPTQAQLAATLGLDRKTIGQAARDLRLLGMLDWQERFAIGARWSDGIRFPQARLARLIYELRMPQQAPAPTPIRSIERLWNRLHSCDRHPMGHLYRVPSSPAESYLAVPADRPAGVAGKEASRPTRADPGDSPPSPATAAAIRAARQAQIQADWLARRRPSFPAPVRQHVC